MLPHRRRIVATRLDHPAAASRISDTRSQPLLRWGTSTTRRARDFTPEDFVRGDFALLDFIIQWQVIGVFAGFIDTDMGNTLFAGDKTSPAQVATKTLEGIRNGIDNVLSDAPSEQLWNAVRTNPAAVHAQMQAAWDEKNGTLPSVGRPGSTLVDILLN